MPDAPVKSLAALLGCRRLAFALGPALFVGILLAPDEDGGLRRSLLRALVLGLLAVIAFGALEQWPRRLPRWLARWVVQVVGVALAIPVGTTMIYIASTPRGAPPFWDVVERMNGFMYLTVLSAMIAPWMALGALVRQKDVLARHQALAFELQRSELERRALDARLHLMQAQVAPHFLFNTLANVQALVDIGSPQASTVLRSLIAYLRASVPRLDEPVTTLGQELAQVEAYLALMQLRMPDRLQYAISIDDRARALRCPPLTLLTLVENAVRHGIDPSEDGGRIDIDIERHAARCTVRVRDTGLGLGAHAQTRGLGTGLATLRERLQLLFGDAATLRLEDVAPRGACAELDLPAVRA